MTHYEKAAEAGTPLTPTDAALEDKLFFTKLPFFADLKLLVDVGSGPLALVAQGVKALRPDLPINCIDKTLGLTWGKLLAHPFVSDGAGLLFSSVIHELFSLDGHYGTAQHRKFWQDVKSTKAEYVIVRDMAFNCPTDFQYDGARAMQEVKLLAEHTHLMAFAGVPHRYIHEFNNRMTQGLATADPVQCSKIIARETLQILMQARWGAEHVPKEFEENYFALHPKKFDEAANLAGYSPLHFQLYNPPGVLERRQLLGCTKRGFTTHIQAVYKKD